MWIDFTKHLSFYFEFLQHLAGPYTNLYLGEAILSNNTPWHFKFVWISITIPESILILGLAGFFIIFFKFFNQTLSLDKNKNIWLNRNDSIDFFVFLLLLCPLLATLKFKNNFDGWRHLYYIYPLLTYHFLFILNKIRNLNFTAFSIINFLIIVNIFHSAYWIIRHHPFQYTYFNLIHKTIVKKNFDLDYMGLSIKNSLEHILENDQRDVIKVSGFGEIWIDGNIQMLSDTSKNRLEVVDSNESDYIIDTFRPRAGKKMIIDSKKFSRFYDLVIDGKIVNRIYKKNI